MFSKMALHTSVIHAFYLNMLDEVMNPLTEVLFHALCNLVNASIKGKPQRI